MKMEASTALPYHNPVRDAGFDLSRRRGVDKELPRLPGAARVIAPSSNISVSEDQMGSPCKSQVIPLSAQDLAVRSYETSWLDLSPPKSPKRKPVPRRVNNSTAASTVPEPLGPAYKKRQTGLRKSSDQSSSSGARSISSPVLDHVQSAKSDNWKTYRPRSGYRQQSQTPELRCQKSFPSPIPAFNFPVIDFQRPRTPPARPFQPHESAHSSPSSRSSHTSSQQSSFSHKSVGSTSSSFSVSSITSMSKASGATSQDCRPRGDTRDGAHAIRARPSPGSYGVAPLTRQRSATNPVSRGSVVPQQEPLRSFWEDSDSDSDDDSPTTLKAVVRAVSSLSFHKRASVESRASTESSNSSANVGSAWHRRVISHDKTVVKKNKKQSGSFWCL